MCSLVLDLVLSIFEIFNHDMNLSWQRSFLG